MSIDALRWAFKLSAISAPGPKFVLVVLADYADEDGSCYPSVEKIAERTAIGRSTVRKHLDWLETEGWISRERQRTATGELRGYRYKITPTGSPALKSSGGPALKSSNTSAQNERSLTPTKINPHTSEPDGSSVCARPRSCFAMFWEAYPLKVGKRKAEPAYQRAAKRAGHEAIMEGLARCVPIWATDDASYTPHPTTWLNRDGWLDQLAPRNGARTNGNGIDYAKRRSENLERGAAVADRMAEWFDSGGGGYGQG